MLLDHLSGTLRYSTFFFATLGAAALASPAHAKDLVKTCVTAPGSEQTATIVFHPKLFGVDGHEGDGDVFTDDFEHRFTYEIKVTDYDQKKPGWTGPTRCAVSGSWQKDWNIPNIRPEFVTQNPGAIIYLKNVPRYSKVSVNLFAVELDDGQNDFLDFDPDPQHFALDMDVLVNEKKAQTMVGKRQGRTDVTLNKAKRVIGDGSIGVNSHDHVRAFIEFVVNVHPDKKWQSDPVMGTVKPGVIPGQAIPGKPNPNDNPQCRDYALKSVEQNKRQLALGCGFQPPVWSNDHQMHFDWCVQGPNVAATPAALAAREAELSQCMLNRK